MALYSYEAFSKDGKKVKGVIDAPSIAAVKEQLMKQGLYLASIVPAIEESRSTLFGRLFVRGITLKDKILFTKQLAVLLKAGVPLLQAIELLTEQFTGRMRNVLVAIKDDVKGGSSLALAMQKYPKVFDAIYVQLVRAGEASGKLDSILERLTLYLERRDAIRRKIRSAMQYPIIQLIAIVLVVTLLLTVVVPQMQSAFEAQGQSLPWATQILLSISSAVRNHFIFIILVIIAIVSGFGYWRRTASGARMLDTIKLKIPVISYIAKTSTVVQFCYTLGILIESGVNLAESLDIVVKIVDNQILAQTLSEARDKIVKQGKIAQYLKQTDIFPPIAIYLIRTGEETGQLGSMLLNVAQNYEVELSELIDTATGLLSPIMLLVMALIVGFVIAAIMMPLQESGRLMSGESGNL